MNSGKLKLSQIFWAFAPFWMFLLLCKLGANLHYSLQSPLGENFLPIWVVGLVMGAASLMQLLLDVPAGHLLDKFGYKRLLRIGTVIFILAASCLLFKFTLTTYLMSVFLSTFGWLFFGPGMNAYILSLATKDQAGTFMSFRDVFNSAGTAIGGILLPFVLFFTPAQIGVLLIIILLFAFLAISFAPKDNVHATAEKKLPTQHFYIRRQFVSLFKIIRKPNPASLMLMLMYMSASIFFGVIWFTIPLILAHETMNGLLGVGLGIFDLSVVLLGFVLGSLADKLNKQRMIFFGLLIFATCGMLLGFGFNLAWLFILFGFLATMGEEVAALSLWSWFHTLDKEHAHDGEVAGIINLFEDLGWMIGPIAAGFLFTAVGSSWTIALGALPILMVWLIYWIFFHGRGIPTTKLAYLPLKPHKSRHKS